MEPEFPLSEQIIIERYELDFKIDESWADVRYSYRMAAALATSGVALFAVTQELTESDKVWSRVAEAGTLYVSGTVALLGGAALLNAAQEYRDYRKSKRHAAQADY